MNSKKRFLTALNLGVPERVPTWDRFDEAVLIALFKIAKAFRSYTDFADHPMTAPPPPPSCKPKRPRPQLRRRRKEPAISTTALAC